MAVLKHSVLQAVEIAYTQRFKLSSLHGLKLLVKGKII